MNELVSVIIPNYKRVNELKRSLNSVIAQTYPNLEILVIDDCSPNFEEIKMLIETYNDTRIKLIKHDVNKGGGAARNTGILTSNGKYIAFLDSDDIWYKEKIEKQLEVALSMVMCLYIINQKLEAIKISVSPQLDP